MKGYLSIREISYKWGVSERRVNQYCTQGTHSRCRAFWTLLGNPGKCRKTGGSPESKPHKRERRMMCRLQQEPNTGKFQPNTEEVSP